MEKSHPFAKLEGHNIHTWQIKLQLFLIERDLWNIVASNMPKLHAVEAVKRTIKDHKLTTLIGLGLSDAYSHYIDLMKTSKKIWMALVHCLAFKFLVPKTTSSKNFLA